ncbi:hypothetical protein VIGAN_04092500 [Vigna angularis var. angularis]|uniref:Uncharacterized protein n=1 Tax=Vigna angularis var. angularis TaxID=157739 RepID=A0A0S3RT38_PHAAN|nr:hypothetical protein VIGAN_04092500 [Vigna angularis var. angularis]
MQSQFKKRSKLQLFIHHEKNVLVLSKKNIQSEKKQTSGAWLYAASWPCASFQYVTPMYSTINTEASFVLNPCWQSSSTLAVSREKKKR